VLFNFIKDFVLLLLQLLLLLLPCCPDATPLLQQRQLIKNQIIVLFTL